MLKKMSPFFGIVLSVLLLWAAFPPLDRSACAWFGLVPLLYVLRNVSFRRAFICGYFFGLAYFVSTLWWIGYVTVTGMLFLSAYLALFWGVFALVYRYSAPQPALLRVFLVPAVYVVLEYVRERALTGFGWASLAHTQSHSLGLIQIADLTGTAGVSFLLVMANVLWCELSCAGKRRVQAVAAFGLLLMLVLSYSHWSLRRSFSGPDVVVSLVQGNISLPEAWGSISKQAIVDKYLELSSRTRDFAPDLVVWPENSFPPFIWEEGMLYRQVQTFAREKGLSLLLGAVTLDEDRYFNSAILLGADGGIKDIYSKRHLVVFGEYIPWRKQLPFLSVLAPIDDFSPGASPAVFRLPGGVSFVPLICFEDTLPWLAREGVASGGQLIVNMTNDAWFRNSPGPLMHLHNAVFRAIENRRFLARAANTGISCFVSPRGEITSCVRSQGSGLLVEGVVSARVNASNELTFYTKYGDVFTILCFFIIMAVFVYVTLRRPDGYKGGGHGR